MLQSLKVFPYLAPRKPLSATYNKRQDSAKPTQHLSNTYAPFVYDSRSQFQSRRSGSRDKLSLSQLYSTTISIPQINFQVKSVETNENLAKAVELVDEQNVQTVQVEKVILSLDLIKQDYPETTYVIDQLIQGIYQYKPNTQLNNKEIEEQLQQQQMTDTKITLDQSGLARVIAKKTMDRQNALKRVNEIKETIVKIDTEIKQQQTILNKLNKDVQQHNVQMKIKQSVMETTYQK